MGFITDAFLTDKTPEERLEEERLERLRRQKEGPDFVNLEIKLTPERLVAVKKENEINPPVANEHHEKTQAQLMTDLLPIDWWLDLLEDLNVLAADRRQKKVKTDLGKLKVALDREQKNNQPKQAFSIYEKTMEDVQSRTEEVLNQAITKVRAVIDKIQETPSVSVSNAADKLVMPAAEDKNRVRNLEDNPRGVKLDTVQVSANSKSDSFSFQLSQALIETEDAARFLGIFIEKLSSETESNSPFLKSKLTSIKSKIAFMRQALKFSAAMNEQFSSKN